MAEIRHSCPDPIEQGALARIHGHPKDACSYPRESEERVSGMEGYNGTPHEDGPDLTFQLARVGAEAMGSLDGPPYGVAETSFDEDDLEVSKPV